MVQQKVRHKIHIRKGDMALVTTGKDAGKKGKYSE